MFIETDLYIDGNHPGTGVRTTKNASRIGHTPRDQGSTNTMVFKRRLNSIAIPGMASSRAVIQ